MEGDGRRRIYYKLKIITKSERMPLLRFRLKIVIQNDAKIQFVGQSKTESPQPLPGLRGEWVWRA
jgi:hypothetical protein